MTDFLSHTIDAETDQDFVAQYTHIQSQLDTSQSRRLGFVMLYMLSERVLAQVRLHLAGKTVREILEAYGDEALVWREKKRNLWTAVRSAFLQGTLDEVQSITCPRCVGALHVEFEVNSPQPDGSVAGYMSIMCTSCNAGCSADSLRETPPWVKHHGRKVVTTPKS